MQFRPKNIACAIDIGQVSVKLLKLQGGKHPSLEFATYNLEKEGFIDSSELFGENGIVKWLRELKMEGASLSVSIPQELCTTKVMNELPMNASNDQLQMMLNTETQNLAGLSGESFAFDFQKMTPVYSAANPVLIGYCRQQLLEQSQQDLANIGVTMSNAVMSGIAMVNTLLALHPEVMQSQEPQIVMDIGKETTSCVVVLAGNILNTTSLLAGTDVCSNNPQAMINELSNAIDNWKASELQDIAEHYIDGIWLCGEGAQTPGLVELLQENCNCNVSIFGPTLQNNVPAPEYAVVYGLALQELGKAYYSLSLAPQEVVWHRQREDRFSTLVLACVLFFLFVFASIIWFYCRLTSESDVMQEKIDCLKQCNTIIPQLDEAIAQIEHQQLMLSPIVELGNRSKIYMRSLEELSSALAKTDWCIYFSDQFSHKDYGAQESDSKDSQKEKSSKRPSRSNLFENAQETETPVVEINQRIVVNELPLLNYLVIGGYTMAYQEALKNDEKYKGRYGAVLKIQENLLHKNDKVPDNSMFINVDWLNENKDWTGREAQVSIPWNAYLKNNKNFLYDYTEFKLKLVLAKRSVNPKEL